MYKRASDHSQQIIFNRIHNQAKMELQKRVKSNGKVEFRTKFGRDKVAVLSKAGDYFYINLYDNRPKYKGNKIFFGVDEIEELVKIKGAIDALKPEFDQVSLVISYTY